MLTEAMSAADLTTYAEIGLLIFVIVFVGIVLHTVLQPRDRMETLARMPIEDREPTDEKGQTR